MSATLTIYEKAKENRLMLTELHSEGTEEVSIDIAIHALDIAEKLALELMRERDKSRQVYDMLSDLPDRLRSVSREVMHL